MPSAVVETMLNMQRNQEEPACANPARSPAVGPTQHHKREPLQLDADRPWHACAGVPTIGHHHGMMHAAATVSCTPQQARLDAHACHKYLHMQTSNMTAGRPRGCSNACCCCCCCCTCTASTSCPLWTALAATACVCISTQLV